MNNTTLRLSVFFPCCYTMIPRLGMAGWTRRGPLVSISRVCPGGFFFLLVGVVGRSWWYGRLMGFRSLGGRVWGEGRWEWDGDTRFAESAWYMWQDGSVHGREGIYCACALAGAASLISLLERCETGAREYMGLLP